ncbi:guanitoxin biosynthesis L-enduracididine beta-hydroxylase GntD [Actinoplanes sp. NPDC048791]|uniref:guanitoxin biosynthesis L-enduracididine beta-hydroxylase GntD n=1 Tax=Actinoplanes sp. NPDC048791 TaxID=3154623 RepID=UPI0033DE0AAD
MHYTLTTEDIAAVRDTYDTLADSALSLRDPRFYDEHWDLASRLTSGLRRVLEHFRRTEFAAAYVLHGYPVSNEATGPTPPSWADALQVPTTDHDMLLAMCGLVLGEPYTWATLQDSSIIQNLLPMRGDEKRQNGYSSDTLLEFHTEDGFHPDRCDYLLLFGVRNHDAVPTCLASVADLKLSPAHRLILSQPRFYIRPDDEHIRQLAARHPESRALARAIELRDSPPAVPVLSGDPANPYLCIDRPFMTGADEEAEAALDTLMALLMANDRSVVVGQGDLLIVDNYRAVHGRRPFLSRYDGTDRWLKRMIVSRNLRRAVGTMSPHCRRVLF